MVGRGGIYDSPNGKLYGDGREVDPLNCACQHPNARECSRLRYGDPIEQRDGECECACHEEPEQ